MGASFLLLIYTTTIIGMDPTSLDSGHPELVEGRRTGSELKQRLLKNNQNNIDTLLEQSTVDDCSICYEEKELIPVPCQEGDKHPKICDTCLDGCHGLCPYCRRELVLKKNIETTISNRICLCCNSGYFLLHIFALIDLW